MAKQYAKKLPDGSYEIAGPVVKVGNKTFTHPTERTLKILGYLEVVDNIDTRPSPDYKIIDEGLEQVGDHYVRKCRRLRIVDDGPHPGPGQEVKNDFWKEVDGKWVHFYRYKSSSRHITPTKLEASN